MSAFLPPGSQGSGLLTAPRGPSLTQLDERARDIFRRIVETYLETGEPVRLAHRFRESRGS